MIECLCVQERADEYVQNLLNMNEKLAFAKHISKCEACKDIVRAGQSAPHKPITLFSAFQETEFKPHRNLIGTFTTLRAAQDATDDLMREWSKKYNFRLIESRWTHPTNTKWNYFITREEGGKCLESCEYLIVQHELNRPAIWLPE